MAGVLLIAMNEVNFEFVRDYGRAGKLPNLNRLIDQHGLIRTTSEASFHEWEPWIQWVTAHTGKTLAEHGVFRLGDITAHDHEQIWEALEKQGIKVGAVSPMNANNRTHDAAFFFPDPWTKTEVTGGFLLKKLHSAFSQAVNDNVEAKITFASLFWLALAAVRYSSPRRLFEYVGVALRARKNSWRRTLVLDALLTDVFTAEVKRTKPQFASLFLNGAAHLQHHYMFASGMYGGATKNPRWYMADHLDPILEAYDLYDRALASIERVCKPDRMIIATGLHQRPHDALTAHWRPKRHEDLMRFIGLSFDRVEPRMSRDFTVYCGSVEAGRDAELHLKSVRASDGQPIFAVDNRGADLFVTIAYETLIQDDLTFHDQARNFGLLRDHVAFVAIRNGEHDGVGYVVDTGAIQANETIPLSDLPSLIQGMLGVEPTLRRRDAAAVGG
jgi:hypothetical protein